MSSPDGPEESGGILLSRFYNDIKNTVDSGKNLTAGRQGH